MQSHHIDVMIIFQFRFTNKVQTNITLKKGNNVNAASASDVKRYLDSRHVQFDFVLPEVLQR